MAAVRCRKFNEHETVCEQLSSQLVIERRLLLFMTCGATENEWCNDYRDATRASLDDTHKVEVRTHTHSRTCIILRLDSEAHRRRLLSRAFHRRSTLKLASARVPWTAFIPSLSLSLSLVRLTVSMINQSQEWMKKNLNPKWYDRESRISITGEWRALKEKRREKRSLFSFR